MEKDYYIVKTIRLMTYLIRKGFNLYRVVDDSVNPYYKVFMFEDTPKLRKVITEYSNK